MLIGAWWWKPENREVFSMSSAYILLEKNLLTTNEVQPLEKKVFPYLWKSPTPLKVMTLS